MAFKLCNRSISLGETSTDAYRGDRGKTAYDHSQVTSGNPHNVTAADIGAVTSTTISNIVVVTSLPADAASHPETLYIVRES